MKQENSTEKCQAVTVGDAGDYYVITVRTNEQEVTDEDGVTSYTYDSNTFTASKKDTNLAAIVANPENYLDVESLEAVAAYLARAKQERADYVSKIIVEVDGLKFDGDETSQDRMARSIVALNDDTETVQWVLADNTVAQVTKVQLKQALRLAGQAQTNIWASPYGF